jgi:alkylation response protein AidB-like acyl-CoA dehydrogenase
MQPSLEPDQQLFLSTTSKFLDELVPPAEVRRLRDDPAGYEPGYWRRGAELGWISLLVPEEGGGGSISSSGLVDLTLVAHEFGTHAAPGPLLPTNIVAGALGRHEPTHALLQPLMAGEVVATWAYTEPIPNDRLGAVTLEARVDASDIVLTGVKRPVESAQQASHVLVVARTGEDLTQILVPTDADGITITPMKTVDLTRRFATLIFDEVRLPLTDVIGDVGEAAQAVDQQLQQALVILAAESVGAMEHAFEMTVSWAFDRYSFGRPLASYQALKHRFADMKSWLEASHAIADAAAHAVGTGSPGAAKLATAASAYIGQYGSELLQDCVQMHGGIGVTFEHDLHLLLRRHTLNRTLYGTPAEHRLRMTTLNDTDRNAA